MFYPATGALYRHENILIRKNYNVLGAYYTDFRQLDFVNCDRKL